jgi:hypothetical protein
VYSRNQWVSTVNLAIYAAGGLLLVVLFMLFRPALPLFCFIGGIASNYAAIAANGMRMPVLSAGGVGRYVPITATTKLWWLGDVIPLASSNGHATAMMSIGDLVLTISLALFAVRIWLSPTPEREYDSD